MTLDERISEDLKTAASQVRPGSPAIVDNVKRRALRRRRRRRTMWVVISGIPLIAFMALTIPYDPNAIDPADSHGISSVEIADLAVPVTDGQPMTIDPDIWVGLRGPSPRFDTSQFGPDLSFAPGEPSAVDLSDRVLRAVYLGELDGEPFYVYSQPAPSVWDRIFEVIDGNFSGDTLGTSLNCCSGGDMDREGGFPGFSIMSTTGEPTLIVAEWLGLSPEVSIVAYEVDGEFIGWQTPVGGTVSLRLDRVPDEIALVSFTAEGEEVGRYAPPLGEMRDTSGVRDTPDVGVAGPTDFVSGGAEIQLAAVRSDELRDLIELRQRDRLYEVPIQGDLVYVVVSPEDAHIYSRSCEVVTTADIPEGLRATCLERTVDGETETGVFHLPEDR